MTSPGQICSIFRLGFQLFEKESVVYTPSGEGLGVYVRFQCLSCTVMVEISWNLINERRRFLLKKRQNGSVNLNVRFIHRVQSKEESMRREDSKLSLGVHSSRLVEYSQNQKLRQGNCKNSEVFLDKVLGDSLAKEEAEAWMIGYISCSCAQSKSLQEETELQGTSLELTLRHGLEGMRNNE